MKCGICRNPIEEGKGHPAKLFDFNVEICDDCYAKQGTHQVELCGGKATLVPRTGVLPATGSDAPKTC